MAEMPKAEGTRGAGRPKKGGLAKNPPKDTATLADQGIDKNLADRARKAAAPPKEKFESEVAKVVNRAVAAAEGNEEIIAEGQRPQKNMPKWLYGEAI
jgi:hypothetical protein